MLRLAWSGYSGALHRRPLATKMATSATLFVVGDVVSQQTTAWMSKLTGHAAVQPSGLETGHDWARTFRMMAFGGLCHALFLHYFWGALERAIPGRTAARIVAKVLVDQTVGASAFYAIMYHFLAVLEGKTLREGNAVFREKYWATMQACWHVWPFVHLVNFSLVPLHYRVLTSNVVNLGWLALLSFLANSANLQDSSANTNSPTGVPAGATQAMNMVLASRSLTR